MVKKWNLAPRKVEKRLIQRQRRWLLLLDTSQGYFGGLPHTEVIRSRILGREIAGDDTEAVSAGKLVGKHDKYLTVEPS